MLSFFKKRNEEKNRGPSDFEIEDDEEESAFIKTLQVNLSRLIAYAESADPQLQREVAEKLANEAVKPSRQVQIVQYGGLKLLVPLTRSDDAEVQRLSAHALANLSVNADNQLLMAREGAIGMLIALLDFSTYELTLRQSAKALANLGVNPDNKQRIADEGGIPKLIRLAGYDSISVRIEAVAALANLAVNDNNEVLIAKFGGLSPIAEGLAISVDALSSAGLIAGGVNDYRRSQQTPLYSSSSSSSGFKDLANIEELAAQCSRAVRNLSVNPANKIEMMRLGVFPLLSTLTNVNNDRIAQQARRALRNLELSDADSSINLK